MRFKKIVSFQKMSYKKIVILFLFFNFVSCDVLDVFKNCGDVECAEKKLIKKIDELEKENNIEVLGKYLVLKKGKDADLKFRNEMDIWERIVLFISQHEMEIKFPVNSESASKLISEARHSKIKKFIIPFMVLLILKKSIELPLFLTALSLVAFKGLSLGFISIILSGATALQSLLQHQHSSKVSYEVVPQLSTSHISRSGVDYPNLTSGYHTIPQY